MELKIDLPMFAGKKVVLYGDDKNKVAFSKEIEIPNNGRFEINMHSAGGFVLKEPANNQ